MIDKLSKLAVFGAGRWGSSLAIYLQRQNFKVTLYSHSQKNAKHIADFNKSLYLNDYSFEQGLKVSCDINKVWDEHQLIFIAIPVQHLAAELDKIIHCHSSKILIGASKGIELKTLRTLPQIVTDFSDSHQYLQLGGPCFPSGLLDEGSLAAETLASANQSLAHHLQKLFSSSRFRIYISDDVEGVALLGAIKNVLAIAAGVIDATNLNYEVKSVLITRGLYEMSKIGKSLGIADNTVYGLSGLGDLLLTCYSGGYSQNYNFGYNLVKLGINQTIATLAPKIAEGYYTAKALYFLLDKKNIDAPLCKAVYQYLYQQRALEEIIIDLMSRPLRAE